MASTNQWCVPDEMNDVLSVEFDRSLSEMEMDFPTNTTSSSVFAVPEINLRKEEMSYGNSEKCQIECSVVHGKRIRYSQLTDIDCSVKRICFNKEEMERTENLQTRYRQQSAPEHRHFYSSGSVINTFLSQVVMSPFHCVLLAPTAISTKINEETLTYLNQGQPYEVKIRKTGSQSLDKSVIFKSIIRVGFQERRLQYMEREQIKEWQSQRYSERILEIDIPLSYGILEATNNLNNINECEFVWDSNYDVGVFIKLNCISSEFTARKHGGEKGVPLRILIETYSEGEKLHSASCQIKVFKPKGADRKHKTDKEKITKRSDKEKYHPQFEYTVFRDLALSDVMHLNVSSCGTSLQNSPSDKKECCDVSQATSTTETLRSPENFSHNITNESSASECILWLQNNMFLNYLKDFENFSGKDLLSLTRSDLIDICGTANGIRLFNALHRKGYLTTYVRLPSQKAYSAIYLKSSKVHELFTKIKIFCGLPSDCSCEFYASGPGDTRVIVTDEVQVMNNVMCI
ncbi:transcription factor CP2-like protein 1 isoform X2 [Parasteatoda tepidariorum]|uniref:transcription factor CP2-like protein 1 isoform X2 n=1 Tax=Parasteatoda tepidariorum TaxID=114398 RepID=UPI001C718E9D|nr:transcription factor CP2-like protein 1 isoform X2 [Parasteatoda tepidariorum]